MIYKLDYSPKFRREYKKLRKTRQDTAKMVRFLIADVLEHPRGGLGHPERLRHFPGEVWSRRIDQKNRLRYSIAGDVVCFERCLGHYGDH